MSGSSLASMPRASADAPRMMSLVSACAKEVDGEAANMRAKVMNAQQIAGI